MKSLLRKLFWKLLLPSIEKMFQEYRVKIQSEITVSIKKLLPNAAVELKQNATYILSVPSQQDAVEIGEFLRNQHLPEGTRMLVLSAENLHLIELN